MADSEQNKSKGKGRDNGKKWGKGKDRDNSNSKRRRAPPSRKGAASKTAYKHKKGTALASQDNILPKHFVAPCGDTLRIMSTAAKGTTVLDNSTMCVDAGNLPVALAKNVKVLMVTHGHSDHMKDVCNAFHDRDGKVLYIFCPAIMAHDLFCKIRYTYQANKGRPYPAEEILDHLKIYAVVRPNDHTFDGQTHVWHHEIDTSSGDPMITGHAVAELIRVGDIVDIDMDGRDKCAIRPFHCHHTVDTVGYCIYGSSRRLNRTISIPTGTIIEITPPKMTSAEKKEYKKVKAVAVAAARADGTEIPDINLLMGRVNFDTVDAFCAEMQIPDDVIRRDVVECELDSGFKLESVRRIEFTADVEFDCFDGDSDDCLLTRAAFMFFKDYEFDMSGELKLDIYHQALTPRLMVFGDTAASVFSQRLVRDMVAEFPRVVIESSFLDGEEILSKIGAPKNDDPDLADDGCCGASAAGAGCSGRSATKVKKVKNAKRNLYLRLKEKKHIFLPELYHLFERHPDTEFVLMHFSDRYDRESVLDKADEVRRRFPNVYFAV
jgi:ribonuclease BN (tRNA processing enzyme)